MFSTYERIKNYNGLHPVLYNLYVNINELIVNSHLYPTSDDVLSFLKDKFILNFLHIK